MSMLTDHLPPHAASRARAPRAAGFTRRLAAGLRAPRAAAPARPVATPRRLRHGRWLAGLALLALAGCAGLVPRGPQPGQLDTDAAARQFAAVVATVEPVAERVCRAHRADRRCDFRIAIDPRRRQGPNAFQTLDADNQPVLIFTLPLIADMRNPDELAFVMSHEASHHILDHLARQQAESARGARAYAEAAIRAGATPAQVRRAARQGADFGARSYSRRFELEADAMGTRIARAAGYDPLRGARYFGRIPDPGDEFLGSHPPNSERLDVVRGVLAEGG